MLTEISKLMLAVINLASMALDFNLILTESSAVIGCVCHSFSTSIGAFHLDICQ